LQQGNVNMPGGNLREGQMEYVIRTMNEFRTVEEIGDLIVSRSVNSVDIRLRDIATITRYHKDRQVITRVNGRESVEIEIFKEADANVVAVAQTVREAIFGTPEQQAYVAKLKSGAAPRASTLAVVKGKGDSGKKSGGGPRSGDVKRSDGKSSKGVPPSREAAIAAARAEAEKQRSAAQEAITRKAMTEFLAYQLPPGAGVELLADQSVFISRSIEEVKSNAVSGGIIAVIVLFLFLRNIGQTIVIGLTIPISIVATFAPMHLAEVSLNIISLGGLALGVGMLVDNGIVVLESIYRCREEGDDFLTSVVRGTQEVGMAVVASTLTTVAVFMPIVFVEGVAGQVFGDMALTVVFSLLASLVAALFLIPMLASRQFSAPSSLGGRLLTSDYLAAPEPAAGEGRALRALRLLVRTLTGQCWAIVVLLAATVKFAAVAVLLALSPLVWLADRFGRRGWWARLTAWAAEDRLGPWVRGSRVWPGLLSFGAPQSLTTQFGGTAAWLLARRGRWLFLVVFPGLALGIALFLRGKFPAWAAAAAATTAPLAPGAAPAALPPWYREVWGWFAAQPWWFLTLVLVPGLFPLVLALGRVLAEAGLRLAGSLLQTTVLGATSLGLGLVRSFNATLGPAMQAGLSGFDRSYRLLERAYPWAIGLSLRNRTFVLGGALLSFGLCWFFIFPRLGRELIPQVHQGEFNLDLSLPIGTPLERTAEIVAAIDGNVRGQPEVERTALVVGAEEGASTSIEAGEHTARLTVRLKPGQPLAVEEALVDRIRSEFRDLPELEMEVSHPTLFSMRSPIEVEIRGHDIEMLKRLSREAETVLTEMVPGLVDVRSTLQAGNPEIQVVYNRDRLAEYGLNLRTVADLVRNKVQGRTATQFRKEDQMIDIVVRLQEEDRLGVEELRRIVVNPNGAVPIPLSAVADLTITEGPSQIRRVDQQRTALITANIRDADLATVSRDIVTAMSTIPFPSGFGYVVAGQNKEMQTSLNSLLLAFALALFLVYIVMASQFESLVQPFLIMMTVPLALIGVGVVLFVGGIPVSIMVFLGLIILAGIVVNNAIVLIDYINTLRGRGMELTVAIVEAGRARLRPILMTTLTTVLGLFPMALGIGEGAEIRAPMAITVIVGLTSSTVLTLLVIPTLYYTFPGRRGPDSLQTAGAEEDGASVAPQPAPVGK
jgi:multidrug efflux pump subunit AcrB